MIAAERPEQRPASAKLLHLDAFGRIRHWPRTALAELLRPGDLLIANDAATLPASLTGTHDRTGEAVEIRLAGRPSVSGDIGDFLAVVFGPGDFRTRTEDRPLPPPLRIGDRLSFGLLVARVAQRVHGTRLVRLSFEGTQAQIWEGIARHGRPIQYAHMREPLDIWDTWTPIAARPVAYEPPSAGFALNWHTLALLEARGVRFATITHAAGISSTGDEQLDRWLPFDEPYEIPEATVRAIATARERGGRVIAMGTTVVRALEHAVAATGEVAAGPGLATGRLGAHSALRAADGLVSGTHEPGTSHYELLRAFAGERVLRRADRELNEHGYRTHEFGDSVFIERQLTASVPTARFRSCKPSSPSKICRKPTLPASAL